MIKHHPQIPPPSRHHRPTKHSQALRMTSFVNAIKALLILRSAQGARLEGRTTVSQPASIFHTLFARVTMSVTVYANRSSRSPIGGKYESIMLSSTSINAAGRHWGFRSRSISIARTPS